MSSDTTDSAPIDDKKTESQPDTSSMDIKGFIKNYLYSIIFTIGISIFVVGTLGLYTTKVAQANILPTSEYVPFTDKKKIVEELPIDINIMRQYFWSSDSVSQKAIFDNTAFLDSYKNSWIFCKLCGVMAKPNYSWAANNFLYLSSVYEGMISTNYWLITCLFYYLSFLPESIIMLLYSFFGIFLWFGLYFINICLSIYYHISSLPQFLRKASKDDKNEWEAAADTSILRPMKIIIFILIGWIIAFVSLICAPIFNTIYGLISPLYATYRIVGEAEVEEDGKIKRKGLFDFIKNTFVYKRYFFLILASLSIISNGNTYLGSSATPIIVVTIILLYIFSGLYSNEIPKEGENGFSKMNKNVGFAKVNRKKSKQETMDVCITEDDGEGDDGEGHDGEGDDDKLKIEALKKEDVELQPPITVEQPNKPITPNTVKEPITVEQPITPIPPNLALENNMEGDNLEADGVQLSEGISPESPITESVMTSQNGEPVMTSPNSGPVMTSQNGDIELTDMNQQQPPVVGPTTVTQNYEQQPNKDSFAINEPPTKIKGDDAAKSFEQLGGGAKKRKGKNKSLKTHARIKKYNIRFV